MHVGRFISKISEFEMNEKKLHLAPAGLETLYNHEIS
jgi:hypothetical protein